MGAVGLSENIFDRCDWKWSSLQLGCNYIDYGWLLLQRVITIDRIIPTGMYKLNVTSFKVRIMVKVKKREN